MAKSIDEHRQEVRGIVIEKMAQAHQTLMRENPSRAAFTIRRLSQWVAALDQPPVSR